MDLCPTGEHALRCCHACDHDYPVACVCLDRNERAWNPEVFHNDSEEVGTGAGEGATGQDTGTAWVTRSADCPEAPAQAHPLGPDGFTRLAGDAAYDRLHGVDGHIQSVTPGRIPPAYHEHDAAGCLDCDCSAAPWSSKAPCTCPAEDAATLAALDRLRTERDEHQWNALEMSRKADQAERRAEDAEAAIEATQRERAVSSRARLVERLERLAETNNEDELRWMLGEWLTELKRSQMDCLAVGIKHEAHEWHFGSDERFWCDGSPNGFEPPEQW